MVVCFDIEWLYVLISSGYVLISSGFVLISSGYVSMSCVAVLQLSDALHDEPEQPPSHSHRGEAVLVPLLRSFVRDAFEPEES